MIADWGLRNADLKIYFAMPLYIVIAAVRFGNPQATIRTPQSYDSTTRSLEFRSAA